MLLVGDGRIGIADLADCEAVTDAKLRGMVPGTCSVPWESRFSAPFYAVEESLERLVEAPQHLLFGGIRKFRWWVGRANPARPEGARRARGRLAHPRR
jgi:hypothetical protein